jgi:hypothetical protein
VIESSATKQIASDIVKPNALTQVVKQLCGFHRISSILRSKQDKACLDIRGAPITFAPSVAAIPRASDRALSHRWKFQRVRAVLGNPAVRFSRSHPEESDAAASQPEKWRKDTSMFQRTNPKDVIFSWLLSKMTARKRR